MAKYLDFFNIYIMGVIEASFYVYFLSKFLKKKIWPPFYFLFGVGVVIAGEFIPNGTIAGFVVFVLLLSICGAFVCHANFKASLLYATLTMEIMLLCSGIVNSLMSLPYPWLPAFFHEPGNVAAMLICEAASFLLSGFCYYIVYRYFSRDALYPVDALYAVDALYPMDAPDTTMGMQQMFLIFVPILMIFIMSNYISAIEYDFQFEILADKGPAGHFFSHGQMLAMYFLGLASLFCILFSYKKLQQIFRLSTEISLLEQQEHSLTQYVEEAKTHYDETKSFRHDIRNHIAVVKNLLRSGKLEEAVSYMEDMDDMAEKMSFPCSTNNPVVDILVGNKLGIAKGMGIDVDCSLLLPYPCSLRDIDICIVLSNALDNAIQAVKKLDDSIEKYIRVSGRIQGDFLMMEIENSFHGKGAFKKGTGLSNVKKVAEKYGGAMSIETQENVFILHVLLIIPQRS
ncbi:MAG: GHKL domain-containing protein [Lachnospiraceae bacterium]